MLKKILEKFDLFLKKIDAPILARLNEGIEVNQSGIEIPILPNDVITFYNWKNGTNLTNYDSLGQLWLFNFGVFLPFEVAIDYYKDCHGQVEKWDQFKFPLFVGGGGEYYLLECDKNSPQYGMIYYHSIGDIDIDVIITKYDSLEAFVRTIFKCYEDNIYTFSPNGSLKFDNRREWEVARKINPKSEYWGLMTDEDWRRLLELKKDYE